MTNKKPDFYKNSLEKSRNKLINLLPLSAPVSISIGITNRCNFGCTFCPTGDFELSRKSRPNGFMTKDTLKKILKDIKGYNEKIRKISLVTDGEPFLHKEFVEFVKLIKESNVTDRISTTTNVSLMHRFNFDEIVTSGLTDIVFSIEHVNDEGYKKVTRNYSKFDQILSNVKNFYEAKKRNNVKLHIHSKILDTSLTEDDKQKFLKLFEPMSDVINIDYVQDWAHSDELDLKKDNNKNELTKDGFNRSTKPESEMICSSLFMYQKIQWNGNVLACCVDWKHETSTGNIADDTLKNIWNGEKLRQLRLLHINKKKHLNPACANCGWIKNVIPSDDLTDDREQLKKIYY